MADLEEVSAQELGLSIPALRGISCLNAMQERLFDTVRASYLPTDRFGNNAICLACHETVSKAEFRTHKCTPPGGSSFAGNRTDVYSMLSLAAMAHRERGSLA